MPLKHWCFILNRKGQIKKKKNEIASLFPDSAGHDDNGWMKSLSKHKIPQDKSAE